jgi:hypothetical protein
MSPVPPGIVPESGPILAGFVAEITRLSPCGGRGDLAHIARDQIHVTRAR